MVCDRTHVVGCERESKETAKLQIAKLVKHHNVAAKLQLCNVWCLANGPAAEHENLTRRRHRVHRAKNEKEKGGAATALIRPIDGQSISTIDLERFSAYFSRRAKSEKTLRCGLVINGPRRT